MTTVAVLGATSGIAHATLRQWAARGDDLRLVARDAEHVAGCITGSAHQRPSPESAGATG